MKSLIVIICNMKPYCLIFPSIYEILQLGGELMSLKKQLVSNYDKIAKTCENRRHSVQERMEKRKAVSSDLKKLYINKTDSLNRLRNK